MPVTRLDQARMLLRTVTPPWRKLRPDRTVRRHVQGVDLYLPWSHVLPDYARARDYYGQNLVELAEALAGRTDGEFKLVDVGANVGDSALQVLRRANGRALCVEGDPYWVRYLRMNVGDDPRIVVEEALLTAMAGPRVEVRAVRHGSTTSFERATAVADGGDQLPVADLHARHPDFADARLIKSDTDGFDPLLVPALARAWSSATPVLFFEFDPALARMVTDEDPYAAWPELAGLGYADLVIWDNTGDMLGRLAMEDAHEVSQSLEEPERLGYQFWDVAACRADDPAGRAAFDELVTRPFDPAGLPR